MTNLRSYKEILSEIQDAWNKAEIDIKLAEQINQKVVLPSINELRYAGRRLVEILHKIENRAANEEIDGLFNDTLFDCLRARHDAIDSAVSKIILDIDAAEKNLGYESILKVFPYYPKFRNQLAKFQENIAKSRKDRNNRENIYHTVSTVDFPKLMEDYQEFRNSEPLMKKFAEKQRMSMFLSWLFGLAGIVGMAVSLINWLS